MKDIFYCQNACGAEDFSIDEWNKAYDEVKNYSEEMIRLVMDSPVCKLQCFDCCGIVGERQLKTKSLL